MITRRYYAIRPTSDLLEALAEFGKQTDAPKPQLLAKKLDSRHIKIGESLDSSVLATYSALFLAEAFSGGDAERAILNERFRTEGFERFWEVESFNDCDDIDDLAAELDKVTVAHP